MPRLFTDEERDLIRSGKRLYSTYLISLSATKTNEEYRIVGKSLIVVQCPIEVNLRLNVVEADTLDLRVIRHVNAPFNKFYLTTTATSSDDLIILVSPFVDFGVELPKSAVTLQTALGADYDSRENQMASADSTTTNLANGATYTGSQFTSQGYGWICGTVYASHAGTLYIDQSSDGTNYDEIDSVAISATTQTGYSVEVVAPYARIRYTNGATTTTTLRVYAFLRRKM